MEKDESKSIGKELRMETLDIVSGGIGIEGYGDTGNTVDDHGMTNNNTCAMCGNKRTLFLREMNGKNIYKCEDCGYEFLSDIDTPYDVNIKVL